MDFLAFFISFFLGCFSGFVYAVLFFNALRHTFLSLNAISFLYLSMHTMIRYAYILGVAFMSYKFYPNLSLPLYAGGIVCAFIFYNMYWSGALML